MSILKALTKEKELQDHEWIDKKISLERYGIMWDMYSKYPGRVIITEDLQENPTKTLMEAF